MPGQFFVQKRGNALAPASLAAQIELDKLKPGVMYKVSPKQPRNGKQHRLFFAFVSYVADALNDGPAGAHWDAEKLKDDLLVATGFSDDRPMSRVERQRRGIPADVQAIVARPKSISFSAMDGQEFSAFMNAAFLYVRDDLAPWIEDSPHWEKIETILAESWLGNERKGDAA